MKEENWGKKKKLKRRSEMDYLVVGLGNPGEKYRLTRHNAGFLVVDYLARTNNTKTDKWEERALCGSFALAENCILLAKPMTYMNLSGVAVDSLINKYALPLSRVIIICDDFSLPFGLLRLRSRGSSGGHKGLASVISYTGEEIPRLRMGIGLPPAGVPVSDYVLSNFSPEEEEYLPEMIAAAGQAVITWIREGIEKTMSRYNGIIPSLREKGRPR